MTNPTTEMVSVGLDVHKASIRLAAVRADELLDERTIRYDREAVFGLVSRWPGVRVCYEAGPTGFGLYRYLVDRESIATSWLRVLCRSDRASA